MNKDILAHHTKLFDWFELEKMTKNDCKLEVRTKAYHMTPIKANAIQSWRTEVNKSYNRKPKSANQFSHRRFHQSARQERNIEIKYLRIKSAPTTKWRPTKLNEVLTLDERMNNISLHYNSERKNIPVVEPSRATTTLYPLSENSCSLDNELSDENESSKSEESKKISDTEIFSKSYKLKPNISMQSVSNNLLNCLTIDDCRMAARYKPSRGIIRDNSKLNVREERKEDTQSVWSDESIERPMKISTGSAFTTLSSLKEQDILFRKYLKQKQLKKKKPEKVENSCQALKYLESRYKICNTSTSNDTSSEFNANHKESGKLYRKLNRALHHKIDIIVNAKKEKLQEMLY